MFRIEKLARNEACGGQINTSPPNKKKMSACIWNFDKKYEKQKGIFSLKSLSYLLYLRIQFCRILLSILKIFLVRKERKSWMSFQDCIKKCVRKPQGYKTSGYPSNGMIVARREIIATGMLI
jgi:hypothetical protein